MLGKGMIAFMDNMLMHAKTLEGLDRTILEVLRRLKANGLLVCIAPDKYEWSKQQVEFLWCMISGAGIEMATEKIQALWDVILVPSLKDG